MLNIVPSKKDFTQLISDLNNDATARTNYTQNDFI